MTLFIYSIGFGQLPSCVKDKCDSILKAELGDGIFNKCIEFKDYKTIKKLNTLIYNPCEAKNRHDYEVNYFFKFPGSDNVKLNFGFACSGFHGKTLIQSKYYYRINKSDLPINFKQKGFKIISYDKIEKEAYKKEPIVIGNKGELVLGRSNIYWVFNVIKPVTNHQGDAELYMYYTVWIDPYSGDIIANEVKSY
jgi:hypothetical protein